MLRITIISLLIGVSTTAAMAQNAAVPDCFKPNQEYEARTQCLHQLVVDLQKTVGDLQTKLNAINADARLRAVEGDAVRLSRIYKINDKFRGTQCLEWLDHDAPPHFTTCVNRPDQNMQLIPAD